MKAKLLNTVSRSQIGYYQNGEWQAKIMFNFKLHMYMNDLIAQFYLSPSLLFTPLASNNNLLALPLDLFFICRILIFLMILFKIYNIAIFLISVKSYDNTSSHTLSRGHLVLRAGIIASENLGNLHSSLLIIILSII